VSIDYLQSQKWKHTNGRFQMVWHPLGVARTKSSSFVVARNSPVDFVLGAEEWKWFNSFKVKAPKRPPRGINGRPKLSVQEADSHGRRRRHPLHPTTLPKPWPVPPVIPGTSLNAAAAPSVGSPAGVATRLVFDMDPLDPNLTFFGTDIVRLYIICEIVLHLPKMESILTWLRIVSESLVLLLLKVEPMLAFGGLAIESVKHSLRVVLVLAILRNLLAHLYSLVIQCCFPRPGYPSD
jgi:hypothetical protein